MARTKEFEEDIILDKAINLFKNKGFNATSAQDLVDGLGISRSSLYDTFGDKRSLFIKALSAYREKSSSEMTKMIEESDDMEITLKQIFARVINKAENNGCFMVNTAIEMASHDKEIGEIVCEGKQMLEDTLYTAVKKGQRLGQITTQHPARTLARLLQNTILGLRVNTKSMNDKKAMDDIINITLNTLKP